MKPDPAAIQELARKKGIRYSDARSLMGVKTRPPAKPPKATEPEKIAAILKIIDKTVDESRKLRDNAKAKDEEMMGNRYTGAVAASVLIQERVRQYLRRNS